MTGEFYKRDVSLVIEITFLLIGERPKKKHPDLREQMFSRQKVSGGPMLSF